MPTGYHPVNPRFLIKASTLGIAAAEIAIALRWIDRIADREDVLAETLRDLPVVRPAGFRERAE
jgi:hypothetical protein